MNSRRALEWRPIITRTIASGCDSPARNEQPTARFHSLRGHRGRFDSCPLCWLGGFVSLARRSVRIALKNDTNSSGNRQLVYFLVHFSSQLGLQRLFGVSVPSNGQVSQVVSSCMSREFGGNLLRAGFVFNDRNWPNMATLISNDQ